MKFKSELSAQIDTTNEILLDSRGLSESVSLSIKVVNLIMSLIVSLLLVLALY